MPFKQHQTRGRFAVEYDDNWIVIDNIDGTLVGFETKSEAEANATFARAYVKRWGDIDLCSFPYDIEHEPHYDIDSRAEFLENRPWLVGTKWEADWKARNTYDL